MFSLQRHLVGHPKGSALIVYARCCVLVCDELPESLDLPAGGRYEMEEVTVLTADRSGDTATKRVQVQFPLKRDKEGWPPADTEEVWAIPLSPETVRVDSIPWFVRNIALDDLIGVQSTGDGRVVFVEKLKWSGNCTLRIIPLGNDSEAGIRGVIERLSDFGVELEVVGHFGLVAANVRPSVDLIGLKSALDIGETQGWWSYEEGCIGGAWPT